MGNGEEKKYVAVVAYKEGSDRIAGDIAFYDSVVQSAFHRQCAENKEYIKVSFFSETPRTESQLRGIVGAFE